MVDEMKPDRPVIPHRLPPTRRQILTQIVVAAVILASGIAIGTGGTILALKDRIARFPLPPPGGRFDPPDSNRPIERWRSELNLTDEQARQIKDLFTKGVIAARERWRLIWEQEQKDREAFVKSMESILTAQQFQTWEQEFRDRERHFQRWRPGGPDDGRGGPDGRRGRGPRGMRGPEFGPDHPPEPGQDGPHGPGSDRPGEPPMDAPPAPRSDGPPGPGNG
jgi:Spy/CpxP family protein refolding chaperone